MNPRRWRFGAARPEFGPATESLNSQLILRAIHLAGWLARRGKRRTRHIFVPQSDSLEDYSSGSLV
jgi:hypothetical protein